MHESEVCNGRVAGGLSPGKATFEVFHEAAAMLETFVLFGHWMELKPAVAAPAAKDERSAPPAKHLGARL